MDEVYHYRSVPFLVEAHNFENRGWPTLNIVEIIDIHVNKWKNIINTKKQIVHIQNLLYFQFELENGVGGAEALRSTLRLKYHIRIPR